jgi:hypothetical protein
VDVPRIAVVIISYNTRDLLIEGLASVDASKYAGELEIVVVDNGSSDGSREAVRATYPHVTIIENPMNRGFGAGCNQAIRATTAPFILLLNSDARLSDGVLPMLEGLMEADDRCGVASCRILDSRGREAPNARNFLTPWNHALEQLGLTRRVGWRSVRRTHRLGFDDGLRDCSVDWVEGACMLLRRAAVEEAGLFDETFFMYSEDEDLCLRLRRRGWSVCLTTAASIVHHGGASTAAERRTMLVHFYLGHMLFLFKHRGKLAVWQYAGVMKGVLAWKSLKARLRRPRAADTHALAERRVALSHAYRMGPWRDH